jgi:RNA polymerase sigma-70 factor (ECF subfamily)
MSDDCPTIENKIISDQVEIDIKRLIEALPIDQQEVGDAMYQLSG